MPATQRFGRSMCLFEVFLCLSQEKLIKLQGLYKRYYYQFAHALIKPTVLFKSKGVIVKTNQSCIKIFDAESYSWTNLQVKEPGELCRIWVKKESGICFSRVLHATPTSVFIIGGLEGHPALIKDMTE